MVSETKPAAPVQRSLLYRLFNNVVSPLFLMFTTLQLVPLLRYTIEHKDGSYAALIEEVIANGYIETFSKTLHWPTQRTIAMIIGFAVFEIILIKVVPGKKVKGPATPAGYVPQYTANGVPSFLITMAVLLGIHFTGIFNVASVYDELDRIYTTLVVSVFFMCWLLYLKGHLFPSHQRPNSPDYGSSGNIIMDYYWGMELYPHIGSLDVKHFFNCRFGMMSWPVLLTVYVLKQYELYGEVSSSMWVSYGIQMVYLTKFYTWEIGYLWTLDIMHDRFGYYIAWGICCWVPSLYTICAQYLVRHPIQLSLPVAIGIFVAGVACIYIQYDIDTQRSRFRQSGGKLHILGKPATYIVAPYTMTTGERRENLLLTSGWWGVSRHINYFFELLMTLLWVPPVQYDHLLPYSYFIFLTGLLLHRLLRDEERCRLKYGAAYEQYCKKVPYYLIPGIF